MIINLFLLFVIVVSECVIVCPNHHWTAYKSVDEMSWSIVIPDSPDKSPVNVVIKRNTSYKCSTEDHVMLCTNRKASFNANSVVNHFYEFRSIISIKCMQNCTNSSYIFVTAKIEFQNKTKTLTWSKLNENTYVEKNCDKFYWRLPNQTINIKASAPPEKSVLICEDCDGEEVDKKYCIGNSTKHTDCPTFWGEWGEAEPCNVISCNPTVSERVRRRKCFHGNWGEADNVEMCSNQTAIMKEQCNATKLPFECRQDSSNNSDYTSVYIGVGVGLFFIIWVSLVYCWCKKKKQNHVDHNQSASNNNAFDIEHRVYNQIQYNTNRNGCLSPKEISTFPYDNRQRVIEGSTSSDHPTQPNNEPSASNHSSKNLTSKMTTSSFLQHHQSSPIDGNEVPMSVGGQSKQTESTLGSSSYVNIHTLSPLDGYALPMRPAPEASSEYPQSVDNDGYVMFEATNRK